MAQEKGNSRKAPLKLEEPKRGNRNPVWRSRRMAAAKNGNTGSSGMLSTQKAAPLPTSPSSRSTSASRKRNDHAGGSDSQVVNTPRRTWYRLSPSRSIRSPSMREYGETL